MREIGIVVTGLKSLWLCLPGAQVSMFLCELHGYAKHTYDVDDCLNGIVVLTN